MINFVFKGVKKDGTSQLYVRLKDSKLKRKDNDKRIKLEGLSIIQKYWNKTFSQVLPEHPNSSAINDKITKYKVKMMDVHNKYSLGQIDFDLACKMLSSEESAQSIAEYIRTVFSLYKEKTHVKNCLETVITVGNHLGIKNLLFTDITETNLMRLKKIILDSGKSPHSYNTYYNNIKTVCNHAVNKKYIYHDFEFDSSWKAKVPPMPEVKSTTPDEIRMAIDNIKLNGKGKRSFNSTLKEFEAVAHWLLMFSMRGFYPSDIHELTSNNLDYDFMRQIEAYQKGYHDEVILGNPHIYKHRRHKSQYPMNIFISLPPIRNIISFLRQTVSVTHPSIAYIKLVDKDLTAEQWVKSNKAEDIDFLKIFSITQKKNPKAFQTTWRLYRKKAKKIKLPSFDVARNTFMSLSDESDIERAYGRTLLGHTDKTISAHYADLKRPKLMGKLTKAHIEILQAFETIELFNYLMARMCVVFQDLNSGIFIENENPNVIYSRYNKALDNLLEKTKIRSLSA